MTDKIVISPITRVSGPLSVTVFVGDDQIADAQATSMLFRGFEWIMQGRDITDAPYLTQRICGICSTAHAAAASYLVDDMFGLEIAENAQYLRNIMYAADFLQNHIRHFYIFGLPDFARMPRRPPFHDQDTSDLRLSEKENERLLKHYQEAIEVSAQSHQLLALFGGKAPHQHSFVAGGATAAPSADKIAEGLSLIGRIRQFVDRAMVPDTQLLGERYGDHFHIGTTSGRFLSFGLFRFGAKNEEVLWPAAVLTDGGKQKPRPELIEEDTTRAWYRPEDAEVAPDPHKEDAYTWVKAVSYAGRPREVGPLARMTLNGRYTGGTSLMDRICARTLETRLIADLAHQWLQKLTPGRAPYTEPQLPVSQEGMSMNDAMRGTLLHRGRICRGQVEKYDVITPTGWNFSPKDRLTQHGPVEEALVGTSIPQASTLQMLTGRIIRSFDPCLSCAAHIVQAD